MRRPAPPSPGCDRTNTPGCIEFACIGFEPAGLVYYMYASPHVPAVPGIGGTPAEFSASAVADLDGDGTIGEFCLQSSNDLAVPGGVVPCANTNNCAASLTPSEVIDCAPGTF